MNDIERVARLLCKADQGTPDKELRVSGKYMWQAYALQAKGLAEAGLVIVPRKLTNQAIANGLCLILDAETGGADGGGFRGGFGLWKTLLAAMGGKPCR